MTERRRPETIWQVYIAIRSNEYAWNIAALAGRNWQSPLACKAATVVAYDRAKHLRELKRKTQNENSTHHTA